MKIKGITKKLAPLNKSTNNFLEKLTDNYLKALEAGKKRRKEDKTLYRV
jgi:hypothetical protein